MAHEETIKRIQELVPSVMALEFGCEISLYSIGMWGHKASKYYYKVISEKNLEGGECMDKVYLLRENGFQQSGIGWIPQSGYPETLEITGYWDKRNTENEYELTKGYFHKDFKILGKPITLSHILLASKGVMIDTVGIFYDVKTLKALNIGCAWNLSQNYDGQSEKTKDIIDKIVT